MSSSNHTFASPADALRSLFAAWPSDRGDGTGLAEAYIIAVEGYSNEAIGKAVKRLIRGEFDWFGGRFLPTTAELSRACRYCEDLMAQPRSLALPAPVRQEPSEDERRRVADRVRGWVKDHTPQPLEGFKPREPGDIVRQMRGENLKLSAGALAALPPLMSTADYQAWLNGTAVPSPAEQYDAWDKAQPDFPTPLPKQKEIAA